MKKCGYIALLGRANAGKSTLLNSCIGQKIAGVSRKPQTTRNKILGIVSHDEDQLVFLDTPGYYFRKNRAAMEQYMERQLLAALADSDVICYLIDARLGLTSLDLSILKKMVKRLACKQSLYIWASKSDLMKKAALKAVITTIQSSLAPLLAEYPNVEFLGGTSAKNKEELQNFLVFLRSKIPARSWDFEATMMTDRCEEFLLSECIREQLFRLYGQELPYGSGVIIEAVNNSQSPILVQAAIIVSKRSHKAMIIGKNGQKIKELGQKARKSLEDYFSGHVFLELIVKHRENWINRSEDLSEIQNLLD